MKDLSNAEYINKAGKNLVNIFKYTITYFLFIAGLVFRLFSNIMKQPTILYGNDGTYHASEEVEFLMSVEKLQLWGSLLTILYLIVILFQVYRAGKNLSKVSA